MIGLSRYAIAVVCAAAWSAVGGIEPNGTATTTRVSISVVPTGLKATSATSGVVAIAWSGETNAKVAVERKVLGASWLTPTAAAPATVERPSPSTIGVVSASTFTDSKVDAFTTYVYRVRVVGANNVLAAPSNEITVGPPPVGFSGVLPIPASLKDGGPSNFANQTRMVFDANGDPTIAYMTNDLNGDGEMDDTDLSVITWNRAQYKWNAPVEIDTIGNVAKAGSRVPFSIARDVSTGTFGVLHTVGEHQMRLSVSSDNGATWKHILIERTGNDEATLSTPSLTMANGRAYLAYAATNNSVTYKSGLVADAPGKWTTAKAPVPQGADSRLECVNVALDATGKPIVTHCFVVDSYNTIVQLWRPEENKTVRIADSNNKQNDDPAVTLTVNGSQLAVAMHANRDEKFFANHHVWFSKSTDNGATWSAPVFVEDDGGDTMSAPLSVMLDRGGHPAIVSDMNGGSEGTARCGLPKLMRSADGARWTTCAPETKGAPSLSGATSPAGAYAGNDKLYIAFKTRRSTTGIPAGLVLWRER
jgi:hypothetical protein